MATVLKLSTPGVYVQEIPAFPPSVAEVETAIPAFIGYTEKAQRFVADDLKLTPTKVTSFNQYVLWYGGAQEETTDSVTISVTDFGAGNANITVSPVAGKKSVYNMYYSLKHFVDNGGGTCYVVSVDKYAAAPGGVKEADLAKGLDL